MAEILNKQAYTVEPDNLVIAGAYPVLHRTIKVTTTVTEKKSITVDKLVWKDSQSNKYTLATDLAFDKTAAPDTGDSSLVWVLLAGFSAFGLLCGAVLIRKKYS